MPRPLSSFLRFALVGACSNAALYALYLLLCYMGIGVKLAMTIAFVIGTVVTFAFNRNWSFESRRPIAESFTRYAIIYVLAYLTNLAALVAFVDVARFPHAIVQGIMVVLIAVLLFVAQRRWVFGAGAPGVADWKESRR